MNTEIVSPSPQDQYEQADYTRDILANNLKHIFRLFTSSAITGEQFTLYREEHNRRIILLEMHQQILATMVAQEAETQLESQAS